MNGTSEYAYQTITSAYQRQSGTVEYAVSLLIIFRTGGGKPVTLSEAGLLSDFIFQYFYPALVIDRINAQIIDAARRVKSGPVSYDFDGSYQFIDYISHSGAVSYVDNLRDRSNQSTA